ncbi:MAG: hypothetical protein H6741_20510 [Alphaproteobacteria bacterium]|nr:hypothetical protein [Alphaproteobacteria bacterium]MCB9795091.1 hypothetical protein [Alphaproteobacteria bacterium]
MQLFDDQTLRELGSLPGASHSFFKQLCLPSAGPLRARMTEAVDALPGWMAERVRARMRSADNRRFFQGYGELAAARLLQRAGWTLQGADELERVLHVVRPDGEAINVMVLSFLHASRPDLDEAAVKRLRTALSRVSSRMRFAVFVRKWLPPNFNPEPVRQAVDIWLREVEAGRWEGRFAAYEDESVVLEFGVTGKKVGLGESPVIMTLGPFISGRVVGTLERRVIGELDRYRVGKRGLDPVMVMTVSDQPWRTSRGYMREFLYGKPRWMATGDAVDGAAWEAAMSEDREPCLFKDPLYRTVSGVVMLERDVADPLRLGGWACSNPLAYYPLSVGELPLRIVAERDRDERGLPIIRWFNDHDAPLDLI